MSYKPLLECVACSSNNLQQVLDLNHQPLANSYPTSPESLPTYPLALNLCKQCWHLQLSHSVDPSLLFEDYLYVSGTSQTLKKYFDWFAQYALEVYPQARKVLDIACNDGSQLDSFQALGLSTFGVDPARNLYALANRKHTVVCDFFNKETARRLPLTTLDIITAQNVVAHTPDPLAFLQACGDIMHNHSRLFVQTSQCRMVERHQFDTVYHEHVSFFSIHSMKTLVERAGLYLLDVVETPIHGSSWIFVIGKTNSNPRRIENLLALEQQLGLHNTVTYQEYAQHAKMILDEFAAKIASYKAQGLTVIGLGAAAKGMTLLNATQVKLDLVLDDNPLKQNRFTPGTLVPIQGMSALEGYDPHQPLVFVPLAWNFFEEMRAKVSRWRPHSQDMFLQYFPHVRQIQ